tara:strand:- start:434 stop:709 length:276 start_codon:yes stop_codon:yes gene_type:complete
MSVNKLNISKNLAKKLFLTSVESSSFLESVLLLIKKNSKTKIVKFSGFGSFNYEKTPQRIGRNPKTEDSYIISELNKLKFKPSNKIKKVLN